MTSQVDTADISKCLSAINNQQRKLMPSETIIITRYCSIKVITKQTKREKSDHQDTELPCILNASANKLESNCTLMRKLTRSN